MAYESWITQDLVSFACRLRLENYAYFEETSRSVGRRVQVVAFFRSAAAEAKEAALLVYIQQQLEYSKMWKLLEFSQVRDAASWPAHDSISPEYQGQPSKIYIANVEYHGLHLAEAGIRRIVRAAEAFTSAQHGGLLHVHTNRQGSSAAKGELPV